MTRDHRAAARDDAGSVSDRAEGKQRGDEASLLQGKLERDARGYHAEMKKRYRVMQDGSAHSYDGFLDMVKEKIGRLRSKIRQYVLKNF